MAPAGLIPGPGPKLKQENRRDSASEDPGTPDHLGGNRTGRQLFPHSRSPASTKGLGPSRTGLWQRRTDVRVAEIEQMSGTVVCLGQ